MPALLQVVGHQNVSERNLGHLSLLSNQTSVGNCLANEVVYIHKMPVTTITFGIRGYNNGQIECADCEGRNPLC